MRILVVGGGSGGHVTPVIAVVREILEKHPRAEIEFWTDKKYYKNVSKINFENEIDIRVRKISAGKLRRYTHFKFIDYLQNINVVFQNIGDFFKIVVGFWQSFWRLIFKRPEVIFLKGGYVCLPVGVMAHILRIPYVIHDSDAAPGLTNRIISKHATLITTGMPLKYYKYPEEKAEWVGIPVSSDFEPKSESKQRTLKKELGFDADKCLVVVTGGSQGARDINEAVRAILPELLEKTSVMLVSGRERYSEMLDLKKYENWYKGVLQSNFRMIEFSGEMWKLFGAADIVISRAGASTMAELASMKKATVVVPNYRLPGYHQVKNAQTYAEAEAAIVIDDEAMINDPTILRDEVLGLVKNEKKREKLAENLREGFSKENAAKNIAESIIRIREEANKAKKAKKAPKTSSKNKKD